MELEKGPVCVRGYRHGAPTEGVTKSKRPTLDLPREFRCWSKRRALETEVQNALFGE
jgi:hypothetical protein